MFDLTVQLLSLTWMKRGGKTEYYFKRSPDLVHLTINAPANYDDKLDNLKDAIGNPLVVF